VRRRETAQRTMIGTHSADTTARHSGTRPDDVLPACHGSCHSLRGSESILWISDFDFWVDWLICERAICTRIALSWTATSPLWIGRQLWKKAIFINNLYQNCSLMIFNLNGPRPPSDWFQGRSKITNKKTDSNRRQLSGCYFVYRVHILFATQRYYRCARRLGCRLGTGQW